MNNALLLYGAAPILLAVVALLLRETAPRRMAGVAARTGGGHEADGEAAPA